MEFHARSNQYHKTSQPDHKPQTMDEALNELLRLELLERKLPGEPQTLKDLLYKLEIQTKQVDIKSKLLSNEIGSELL